MISELLKWGLDGGYMAVMWHEMGVCEVIEMGPTGAKCEMRKLG